MAAGFGPSILRETRMRNSPDVVDGFRMRGREVTRLESFADAIFAFALTLLIVSLEVPKSFADLIGTMRGFPAFAVCFVMLATIWNRHYKFSRRFGLDDPHHTFPDLRAALYRLVLRLSTQIPFHFKY
jgi:hypothetical protein